MLVRRDRLGGAGDDGRSAGSGLCGEYGSVWTPVVTTLLVVLGATAMAPICRGYVDDDGAYVFRA